MFYLIWEMGILLLLAVGFGVFVGYQLWSGDARSAEADTALAENARLRQENENLARRLGAAESPSRAAVTPDLTPVPAEAPDVAIADTAEPDAVIEAPKASKRRTDSSETTGSKAGAAKPAKPVAVPEGNPKAVKDELSAIKGLGPKAAATLAAGGVTSLAQIAAWSEADIKRWDQAINGRGRIMRDDWVGQARKLAG